MSLCNGERMVSARRSRAKTRAWELCTLIPAALFALMVLRPMAARGDADDDPADVVTASALDVQLPSLPEGFVQRRTGNVAWAFHERDADLARSLINRLPAAWRKVVGQLGREISSQLTIRLARGADDMLRLAPRNNPPPPRAVGVAYPSLGLIILSAVSPDSWFPPDQLAVMTHELSHVALHRAVDGRPLPLWFVEGLAAYQSGEHRLAQQRELFAATISGELLPLELVSRSFPTRPHAGGLAYAESADLVRHLLQSTADHSRLSHLLAQVAEGVGFEAALSSAYRIDLPFLEREWRQGLSERFRVLPLVLTGTALWGGIALLAIVAFVRRRQQHKEGTAQTWEGDEAAEQVPSMATAHTPTVPAQPLPAVETRMVHVYALPPPVREAGVPTVEHDGQRHTLH